MHQSPDFDFEEWAALAKTDSQAFEARREEVIAAFIAKASPGTQARLRGLQWQIDMERRRAANPMASCVRIFNQMWEAVYGERGLLEVLCSLDGDPLPERFPADVLKFSPQRLDRQHGRLSRPSTHT